METATAEQPAKGPAPPSADVLQAAGDLGFVYQLLRGRRQVPFDRWVHPRYMDSRLDGVLTRVYPEVTNEGRGGRSALSIRRSRYAERYATAMDPLRLRSQACGEQTLAAERDMLHDFARAIEPPPVAARLHATAGRILARAHVKDPYDKVAGLPWSRESGRPGFSEYSRALRPPPLDAAELRARMAPAVREEGEPLLSILFLHPDGTQIVRAFGAGAEEGVEAALIRISAAADAAAELLGKLENDEDAVWRFPPILTAGAVELGVADAAGFLHYAVSMGALLGRSAWEEAFVHLGMVLFAIGLVFTGPVGVVVVGALDVALAGAQFAVAYARDREQELGATASRFRPEDARLGERTRYGNALDGAASMLLGMALLAGPGRRLLRGGGAIDDIPVTGSTARPERPVDPHPRPRETWTGPAGGRATEDRALDRRGTEARGAAPSDQVPPAPKPRRVRDAAKEPDRPADDARMLRGTSDPGTTPSLVPRRTEIPAQFADTPFALTAGTGGIARISPSKALPDGRVSFTIEGEILAPLEKRLDFEKRFKRKHPSLWPDYEAAHLWGPGWGDEAYAGIMYAPPSVNRELQRLGRTRGIEGWIQEYAEAVRAFGGRVEVTATAVAHPKARLTDPLYLAEAKYEIRVMMPNGTGRKYTLGISVGSPPKGSPQFDLPALLEL